MVFVFPVKDTLEIFGMEIDNELNFSKHISNICKKNNNQFNVMLRFRKLIRLDILLKLYKSYIFYLMFIQGPKTVFCEYLFEEANIALNFLLLEYG